jgi:hypothetical protein
MLQAMPLGVAWGIIPFPKATSGEQLAAQTDICWRATSIVDTYCHQVLRATVDSDQLSGPGGRVGIDPDTGNGVLIMRRWPVMSVLAVQTARNAVWPWTWSTVPAGMYAPEHPLINSFTDAASATAPDGGWKILLAPGFVTRRCGRNSTRLWVSYTNGWPHTSLTQPATAGASVLYVDDVTGFTGAAGFAYDGAGTEQVSVLSVAATTPLALPNGAGTAQTGPGTVTLASPLASAHAAGVVVSSLPANVIWASALAASSQALEAGITSVSIQNLSGAMGEGGKGVTDVITEYEVLLESFRRVA